MSPSSDMTKLMGANKRHTQKRYKETTAVLETEESNLWLGKIIKVHNSFSAQWGDFKLFSDVTTTKGALTRCLVQCTSTLHYVSEDTRIK